MQRHAVNPQGGLCGNEWYIGCICVDNNGFNIYCDKLQTLAHQNGLLSKYLEKLVNIIYIQTILLCHSTFLLAHYDKRI